MKTNQLFSQVALILTLGLTVLTVGGKPVSAATPFEQSVYLYNTAYDADLSGTAGAGSDNWKNYKAWLGVEKLGAEADPGWGNWWDCCEHVSWNSPWAAQQQRHGTSLPTVLLGIGQMPFKNGSAPQDLTWADQQWQLQANNDPTLMGYFANYAREVNSLGFKKVVIRLGYEFDGFWNPYGNLNSMSNMPNNYIASWRNIVNTMRANDSGGIIKFCWNPTDSNVQINSASYYPGDDYVDYIGFDTYDYAYNGRYPVGTSQPTQAQRDDAWYNSQLPRINAMADMGRAHGKPLIIGEWGLWQLNDSSHPSGGDNTSYIQRMYDWMSDPYNNVAIECYFESPADGNSSLSGIFGATTFPNSAALYKELFGDAGNPSGIARPTGLTAVAGSSQVTLSWTASAGATSYNLYRGTTSGGESSTPVATGITGTSTVNLGLTNGTRYYYKVKAVTAAGISGYSPEVSATPVSATNYLVNPGFESGNLNGWNLWVGSNGGAAYAGNGSSEAHTGSWGYVNWSPNPYQVSLWQQVNVPNGPHTVSAWIKSSGGQTGCQMQINSYDGSNSYVHNIGANGAWQKYSATVNVTTGTLGVAFYSLAGSNQWINVDDVEVN